MKPLLLPFLMFVCSFLHGQTFSFSGTVLDPQGKPLEYVTITDSAYTLGTLTDEKGYFDLKLSGGSYVFVFQYLGFKELRDTIQLSENLNKTYRLQTEELVLQDVIITSDGRDPAYGIIQKAIERKKANATPFKEYAYKAYTKTLIALPDNFRLDDLGSISALPEMGKKKNDKKPENKDKQLELPPELQSKILYLTETFSEVSIKEPEKAKEKIVSSRVSGDSKAYSMFGSLVSRFNPYENRLVMEGVADRGIVMPLSDAAFSYYDYKLLGIGYNQGIKYYKIQLIPKREYDPVCKGLIYIADSSYAIKEIDVAVDKTQRIELMDALRFHQQYFVSQQKWLPYNTRMEFDIAIDLGVLKIPLEGFSVSLLSNYDLYPVFGKKTFNNELISVSDSAGRKPKSYWENNRPIPLTFNEQKDFNLKDSLEFVRNSPRYLDSLQRRQNRPNFNLLLSLGQTFKYYRSGREFSVSPLLEMVGFNPMEGLFIAPVLTLRQQKNAYTKYSLEMKPRYGFLSKKIGYSFVFEANTRPKKMEKWQVGLGDYVAQFSGFEQLDLNLNTYNCLYWKLSRARLYQQKFAFAAFQREWVNGLFTNFRVEFQDRTAMQNRSDYTWARGSFRNREYASNNPDSPLFPSEFSRNQAFFADVEFRYTPGQQYISLPNQKVVTATPYPLFSLQYKQAIPILQGAADFALLRLGVEGKQSLGMLGSLQWQVRAGKFLYQNRTYFPDIFHYKTVETTLHKGDYRAFFLLPYYRFSDTLPYLETHLQHAFSGFLLNKIPLVRKWKLNEYAGIHLLWQQGRVPHLEANVGVEKKILKLLPLRLDFCWNIYGPTGYRYDYKIWMPPTSALQAGF